MTPEAIATLLLHASLAVTAALLLCFALRLPLRRVFGARIAYGVWLLVPAALAAACVPRPRGQAIELAVAAAPAVAATPAEAAVPLAALATPFAWSPLLVGLWAAGACLAAGLLALRQRRYVRSLAPLVARDDGAWASGSADVPVVIGVLRPRIVLPSDFDTRYPATQAALVLAHERAHVARGDVPAHLVVALVRCLQWFNPLVHIGARRFRDDQELACDATVLAAHPAARRSYADAMLNTRLAAAGLPVGCHWTSRDAFKERIMLLKQPLPGTLRRRAGRCAVVVLLALSSVAAWAALPATAPATDAQAAETVPSSPERILPVRQAAVQVIERAGYRVASLDALPLDRTVSQRAVLDPALTPEQALQRIAMAGGTGVGVENGAVSFLPLETGGEGAKATAHDELLDLRMQLSVGGEQHAPRLVVREGEPFALRVSSEDGSRLYALELTAHRLSPDTVSIMGTAQRDTQPQGRVRMTIREGVEGTLSVGSGVDDFVFSVIATGNADLPKD